MKLHKKNVKNYYLFALLGFSIEAISAPRIVEDSWSYTVKKNDALELICAQYCIKKSNIHQIAAFNQLRNLHLLHPNQTIKIPLAVLKTIAAPAKVVYATGDVQIKKSELDAFQKINRTEPMLAGAMLKTGLNSIAKLRFADGSETVLQPNSTLKVLASHQYAGKLSYVIKLKLSAGRTEIIANPEHLKDHHLEVETPSAVAVVRGTQFRVAADKTTAIEETLHGQVGFSAAENTVAVSENFGSVSIEGQPPLPPQALPNPPDIANFPKIFDELPVSFSIKAAKEDLIWAQLAKDAAFTEVVEEQTLAYDASNVKNLLVFNNLSPSQYFLKLRTQNAQGLQSVDAIHAFTMNTVTVRPALIFPREVTLVSEKTVFQWTDMPNKYGFLVQVASDVDFNHIVLERVTSFNAFNLVSALPKGEYYWRVAEKSGVEHSQLKFSTPAQFNF